MQFPENLKYTKDHEWLRVEGNVAVMGITEFAQEELGEVVFVDLPGAGKQVKQGETLTVVESTKAASDVYAPVGGKVKEANSALSVTPALVNKSPYGDGWMVKLEGFSAADVAKLMSAAEYKSLVGDKA